MKKIILIIAALALSGAAYGQTVPTVNSGDLIIGFEQGTASNLEIDLGNISNFTSSVNLGNISSLLSSSYTTWSDSTNGVSWSVAGSSAGIVTIGSTTYNPRTLWVSEQQSTGAGVQGSTVNASVNYSGVNTAVNAIVSEGTTLQGASALASSGWLFKGSLIPTGTAWNYSDAVTAQGLNSNYGTASKLSSGSVEQTGSGSVDLYLWTSATSGAALHPTFLGTFDLSSSGQLTFTSTLSAVPEPSTYAMILGVAVLGFVMIRRRQQVLA